MKGFIFNGAGNIELKDIELQPCGENDIIVRNICSGICGSDVSAYQYGGESVRISNGSEFGHEMVSEVVEVGKNVKGIKKGDRVYPYPITCKGSSSRAATVGGFSEYVHIPNCKLNHSVFKVHKKISNRSAAMIEPFTVGGHAAKLANPSAGKTAVVFGAGIIGVSAAITLKYMGCDKVLLADFSKFRLEKAKNLGFEICNLSKEDFKTKALNVFGEAFGVAGKCPNVDIYIDAAGAGEVIDSFIGCAKLNAKLVIVGVHHSPRTINLIPITYGSLSIQGSGGYDTEDVKNAMDIMKSGKFDIDSLVSHSYQLKKLEQAIKKATDAKASLKVVIEY